MLCLFFAECKRNIKIKGKSCKSVSQIWRKHLIEIQEKLCNGDEEEESFRGSSESGDESV